MNAKRAARSITITRAMDQSQPNWREQLIQGCRDGDLSLVQSAYQITGVVPEPALVAAARGNHLATVEWVIQNDPETKSLLGDARFLSDALLESKSLITSESSAELILLLLDSIDAPTELDYRRLFQLSCRLTSVTSAQQVWDRVLPGIMHPFSTKREMFMDAAMEQRWEIADALQFDRIYMGSLFAERMFQCCRNEQWNLLQLLIQRYSWLAWQRTIDSLLRMIIRQKDQSLVCPMLRSFHQIYPILDSRADAFYLLSRAVIRENQDLIQMLLQLHPGILSVPGRLDRLINGDQPLRKIDPAVGVCTSHLRCSPHTSLLEYACRGSSLEAVQMIWRSKPDLASLFPMRSYLTACVHGRVEIADWLLTQSEIDPLLEIEEQVRGACYHSAIPMLDRLEAISPGVLLRVTPQVLFARACHGNAIEMMAWLLERYPDQIDLADNDHHIFNVLSQTTDQTSDAMEIVLEMSANQEYRYRKHRGNYFLINHHWQADFITSVHLIDGIYVCSAEASSLEDATDCLHLARRPKSARSVCDQELV